MAAFRCQSEPGDHDEDGIAGIMAQTQHSNHGPQTACNMLSSKELWRGNVSSRTCSRALSQHSCHEGQ